VVQTDSWRSFDELRLSRQQLAISPAWRTSPRCHATWVPGARVEEN